MTSQAPAFDLSTYLPYRMTVAAEKLSTSLAKRYRTQFGISIAEWRVLVHLLHSGEVSVRDLEQRVNLEKSKASRAATRLEAEGYITKDRNAEDRRLIKLALTEKGRALMCELVPLATAFQDRLHEVIAEHMAGLDAALDAIIDEDL
ncbi:MarR family winged helix-turn-helix transcriptional regulator [Halovulum sp. GXIMD14794]